MRVAISPPSDILLDVANAADPQKVKAATARLAALAADPTARNVAFTAALREASAAAGPISPARSSAAGGASGTPGAIPTGNPLLAHRPDTHGKASPYTKFEAVLLQNFVESMLPKDDELFGDKQSAGVYRSMMAEQIANQIAGSGGIGIAHSIEKSHPPAVQAGKPRPT